MGRFGALALYKGPKSERGKGKNEEGKSKGRNNLIMKQVVAFFLKLKLPLNKLFNTRLEESIQCYAIMIETRTLGGMLQHFDLWMRL